MVKMHLLSAARPIVPSLPKQCQHRVQCYASRAITSTNEASHTYMAQRSNKSWQRGRRLQPFGFTPPIRQSSTLYEDDNAVDLRQKIIINPGGSHGSKKKQKKKTKPPSSERPFIDRVHLKTRGGSGGSGCISYHKLGSYKKKPSGGHGGKGGSVYLVTDPTLSSLKMEKHHYFGQDGGKGGVNGMQGRNGKDCYVRIPCGVVVRRVLDWEEVEEMHGEGEEENEGEGDASLVDDGEVSLNLGEGGATDPVDDGEVSLNLSDEVNMDGTEVSDDADNQNIEHSEESSMELDSDDNDEDGTHDNDEDGIHDNIDAPPEAEEEKEEEEDFDTYYARLQSKRQRKRGKRLRGYTPSDYDEVVDQEVRAEDGMYYWSTPEPEGGLDGDLLASTAYPEMSNPMVRKSVFVADLDKPNSSLLVAAGGKAGVGNLAYANRPYFTSMNANAAKKSKPAPGECTFLELELKLIADVGLVGFPNAGKSSLLSAMSRAKPKIASYPFTTLHPLVGSIQYRDGYHIVMADVPGLIDGAAEGRGKGTEFLRHIERTKALVYMVDIAGVDGRDPVNDLRILGKELKEYGSSGIFGENEMGGEEGPDGEEMRRRRREIMERPSLILANKMDLISEEDAQMGRKEEFLFQLGVVAKEVGIACHQNDIMGISARVTGEGLREVSKRLRQVVKEVDES